MYTITDYLDKEKEISKNTGVDVHAMKSKSRRKEICLARHYFWFIAHDKLGFTYKFIAENYYRDHSTIIEGVKRMRKYAKQRKGDNNTRFV